MCRRIFLSVLFFTAVLLLKVDFFDSYALPLKGDIEVQTEDGSNTVEAPGIIVIQDTVSGEDGLETEGLQDNKDDRINKAAQEKQADTDVPLQASSQGAAGEESCGMFEITGYCSCELCTGENHFTKSGTAPRPDYTVAADPDVFPLGSRIRIGEIIYLVEDTGASIKGNVVDIYYETHEEAVANGRYEAEVFLIRGM